MVASGKLLFGLPQPPPGYVQRPPGISLCMIVKNEEKFLPRCLQSVAGVVDEINIVDTGSTDGTIEIARSFGARVERREWRDDFAWARNEALALATKRWILVLDADEELNADSRDLVAALKTVPAHLTGVWVRCLNLADDYKGTGACSHALGRIFPNSPRIRYRSPIHEFITLDQNPTGLDCRHSPIAITHHGYLKDVVEGRDKVQRNLELIRKAAEAEPDEPFHWYNMGVTAMILGDRALTISALERMFELVGEKPRGFVPVGLSTLAEAYGAEEPEKAMHAALESLKRSPHFCNAHFALGRALTRMKRYEEAREAFKAAIDDGKYNAMQFICDDEVSVWKAHSEIGYSYTQEGNHAAALEWFEKGLANRQTQPLRLNRARALEALQRYDEAEEAFAGVCRDFGDDQSVGDYVNFLLRRHKYHRALETIDLYVGRVGPKTALAMLKAAAAVCDRLALPGAEAYLERALALAPGSAAVLDELERRYAARNDTAALERLHATERDAPCVEPEDYARRSTRLLAEGDPERALRTAHDGLAGAAEHPRLLHAAALAATALGRKDEALRALDRIRPSADPEIFARATYLRSLLLYERGEHRAALVAIDTVTAAKPDDVDALLHRARILQALRRYPEAEATLRRALPLGGRRVAVVLAGFFMQIGDYERARLTAEEALATA